MSTTRTVQEKTGDWYGAFVDIRAAITPDAFRGLIDFLGSYKVDENGKDAEGKPVDVVAYASLVQASIHLARIVSANDRAAAIAAAMLTQSGISRPIIEETE